MAMNLAEKARMMDIVTSSLDHAVPTAPAPRPGRGVRSRLWRMAEALCAMPEPPTAILAGNDLLAMGAIAALGARGLRVPRDVAVAGFDDFAFSEHTDPPLTTVRVPGFDLGRRAAERLVAGIEGRESGPVSERLPVELVIRRSA